MQDEERVTGEGGGNRGQFLALPEASLGSLLIHIGFNSTGPWTLLETTPHYTAAIINLGFGLLQGVCANSIIYHFLCLSILFSHKRQEKGLFREVQVSRTTSFILGSLSITVCIFWKA